MKPRVGGDILGSSDVGGGSNLDGKSSVSGVKKNFQY